MKKTFFYGYVIVAVIFILQIVMFGPRVSFGVFIKPITAEFDWPRALVAGAFSVSTIIQAFSSIFMGWLNDRKGPRFVLTICGILVGTGLCLMFFVHSAWQLYLFYVAFIGVGMGSLVAPQMSTIARWFVKRRNMMTAILMAGGGLGGIIGPPLITWIIYNYSWRQAFLFVGIGVFVLVVLAAQFLRRDPSKMGQVPYGEGGHTAGKTFSDVSGLSSKQAFRTGKFWLFAIIQFCIGFSLWTVLIHIVPFAIDRGISPETAAIVLAAMNGAQPVGSIFMGIIADKVGNRKVLVASLCLLSPVILLLLPVTNPWLIGLFVMLIAFGLGGTSVVQSSITAELFGMKSHGAILGYTVFAFSLGGAFGNYMAGAMFDLSGNYHLVFATCGVLVAAAIIIGAALSRVKKMEEVG
jgi:MFS family permease